jgi:hypothetical protein
MARALAALLLTSCSFVFVHGPEVGVKRCTSSDLLPALDAGAAIGAFAGLAVYGMKINDHARGDGEIGEPIGIATALLVAGVLYTVSAVGGHQDAVACRARRADAEEKR